MPSAKDEAHAAIKRATDLAREVAPDIGAVLLTHYPDAETLDTLRPGGPDLATVTAVNRAVAQAMAQSGVDVLVQRADRAAFRRWMAEREDTAENRLAWIDRAGLLRGAEAFALLGLAAPPAPRRMALPKAPGAAADRLLRALDSEDDTFEAMAEAIIEQEREDILALVLRKAETELGEEVALDVAASLLAAAEGVRTGPSALAELAVLPVALPHGSPPDGRAIGDSLLAAGLIEPEVEIRFVPGWRSPEALAALSPVAIRRVLHDLVAGREPRDLPRGDTEAMAREGFGLLLGLRIDWAIPVWEAISAAGGLPPEIDPDAAETPEEARQAALYDSWRTAIFDAHDGCVPLAIVPPSAVEEEIALFLEEAGEETGALEEIRTFVETARGEAPGEVVLCRIEILGDDLELSLYTEAGRFLDSLTLAAASLPAPAADMPRLIEAFVPLMRDRP